MDSLFIFIPLAGLEEEKKVHITQPIHKVANRTRTVQVGGPPTSMPRNQPKYSPSR